ncbi:MAG: E3 binding domain-containing protein, partial [Chrysiogenetes bacterium]|nr:E3 binding domain-containing protein [Chrysiogenetes bacterium]
MDGLRAERDIVALKEIQVPDIGEFESVEVIELLVAVGDEIKADQGLVVLESDKASMDIPAPYGGVVKELKVKVGDHVSKGSPIAVMEVTGEIEEAAPAPAPKKETKPAAKEAPKPAAPAKAADEETVEDDEPEETPELAEGAKHPHASPSVRRFARELGVNLAEVPGTGRKGRILKDDVQNFVKHALSVAGKRPGSRWKTPPIPEVDFTQFGEIETQPLTKIQKVSGRNLHRSWLNIPHVTQFDEADITELEA